MATLIIRRQKTKWQDKFRDYGVLLDGREVSRIGNGDEIQLPIQAGSHLVQLKIDWCYSPELRINAAQDEKIYVECGPNSSPLTVLLYITLLRKKYLWLRAA
jgi:hypothetical protein